MRGRLQVAALVLWLLLPPAGQSPAQEPSCEDQLRAARVLADRYQRSRMQSEIETSALIADLLKQNAELRAALEAAKAAKAPTEPKK